MKNYLPVAILLALLIAIFFFLPRLRYSTVTVVPQEVIPSELYSSKTGLAGCDQF